MKLLSGFVSLSILSATIVSSIPITRRDVNEALVPQFGFSAGVNPTGTGDCDGAVNGTNGQPIKIPCSCPPDRAAFIQSLNGNVAAGHAVNNPSVSLSFPEDNSTASQLARINAAIVTLQNLNGSGQGCPVVSTTFQAQADALNIKAPQVVEDIFKARQLASALAPRPTFTPLFPPVIEDILKARDSETALSPVVKPVAAILKARDSETASSPAPTPTLSLLFPPIVEHILKRQSTPSPSPSHKPEIILAGPPIIEARDNL